jgi:hypothetical protein
MSAVRFPQPRCTGCGNRLTGVDLWVRRYARTIPRDVRRRCSRCNARATEGDKEVGNDDY